MEVARDLEIGKKAFSDERIMNELYAIMCIRLDNLDALKELCEKREMDLLFEYLFIKCRCLWLGTALFESVNRRSFNVLDWLLLKGDWSEHQLKEALSLSKGSWEENTSNKMLLSALDRLFPDFLERGCVANYVDEIIKCHHWDLAKKIIALEANNHDNLNVAQNNLTTVINHALLNRQWDVVELGVATELFKTCRGGLLITEPNTQWGSGQDHYDKMLTFSEEHLDEFLDFLMKHKKCNTQSYPFFYSAVRQGFYGFAEKLVDAGELFDLRNNTDKVFDVIRAKKDEKMFQLICMNPKMKSNFGFQIDQAAKRFHEDINAFFVLDRFPSTELRHVKFLSPIYSTALMSGLLFKTVENSKVSAIILYAQICLVQYGYFRPVILQGRHSFLKITASLPSELQMMICNRTYDQPETTFFSNHEIKHAILYILKKYETPNNYSTVSRCQLLHSLGLITNKQYNNFFCFQ
jgi:hypothetical protein